MIFLVFTNCFCFFRIFFPRSRFTSLRISIFYNDATCSQITWKRIEPSYISIWQGMNMSTSSSHTMHRNYAFLVILWMKNNIESSYFLSLITTELNILFGIFIVHLYIFYQLFLLIFLLNWFYKLFIIATLVLLGLCNMWIFFLIWLFSFQLGLWQSVYIKIFYLSRIYFREIYASKSINFFFWVACWVFQPY